MKYPALDVTGVDADLLAAVVDDFSPTAAEQDDTRTTYFFADARGREQAHRAIAEAWPTAALTTRDVDDEDWARRSQQALKPITVGRITIVPRAENLEPRTLNPEPRSLNPEPPIHLVIVPSMGFGTGHHATTRLCLAALQQLRLQGARVLDVGTGSGILAIAARALGADEATGIDVDGDAIQAAQENLDANPEVEGVQLVVGDLRNVPLDAADVVLANLTGALLVQTAPLLLSAMRPRGTLIVSGVLADERDSVVDAFAGMAALVHEAHEEGWVGLTFRR